MNSATCFAHFNPHHHVNMSIRIFSLAPTWLLECTFSFRRNLVKSTLTNAYIGTFQVIACGPKTITIDINTTNVVSVDRAQPAYLDAILHCTAADAGLSRPEATSSSQTSKSPAHPTKRISWAPSSHLCTYSTNI